jgi:hypothetical protein
MRSYDSSSFSAGQESGARTAACVARLAALELIDGSHWWNRRRHRLMARALVACAEEMELAADEGWAPLLLMDEDVTVLEDGLHPSGSVMKSGER